MVQFVLGTKNLVEDSPPSQIKHSLVVVGWDSLAILDIASLSK